MHVNVTTPSARRRRNLASIAGAALLLGACAQIPSLGEAPVVKGAGEPASAESFASPPAQWPQAQWWQSYGDAQLDALVDEALGGAPDLAVANARLAMSGAVVQGVGSTRMPEVNATVSATEEKQSYNYLIPSVAVPRNWHDYGVGTINLGWELDFWGKNRSALAAAVSEQKASAVEVEQARLALSTSVASAYAGLAHLYAIRDSASDALQLRTKTVALFRQRREFELENLATVRQVEAREAAARAELLLIDERIALQKNAIAALLGAGPDRGLSITRPAGHFAGSVGLPQRLALDLVGRRPDVVAARLRVEAAAKRIDQQKAGFYPSVNLMAFVGVQSLGLSNLTKSGSDIGSIGPAVSLPIFNTERLQGQLRGARAEYDAAVAVYNATLTNALREVADSATSRKALEGEILATRAAVDAADEAHQIVSKRYSGELATYLDVLTAEDALVSARRSLAELDTRAWTLDIALVRALGGGFREIDAATPLAMNRN